MILCTTLDMHAWQQHAVITGIHWTISDQQLLTGRLGTDILAAVNRTEQLVSLHTVDLATHSTS